MPSCPTCGTPTEFRDWLAWAMHNNPALIARLPNTLHAVTVPTTRMPIPQQLPPVEDVQSRVTYPAAAPAAANPLLPPAKP